MNEEGSKPIEIIPLAQKKIARRGIAASLVEDALTKPDQIVAGHDDRSIAQKRVTLRQTQGLLRVIYEETETHYVVVTAYFTSDIARYWRETP